MKQYNITGMSCAACQARVEKAVGALEGVESCNVSLLTNSMGVEGSVSEEAVIKAIQEAGYGATVKGDKKDNEETVSQEEELADKETPVLKKRLFWSIGFLIVLMYFSMGHMMWGWPLPAWFRDNYIAIGIIQMFLAGIVMVINQKFFVSGFRGLVHRAPNMDTLVALGSSASFGWSVFVLLKMTRASIDGNSGLVLDYMMQFYFESAAMILALITVGKMLEARSKGKTTNALKGLMKLAPKRAWVEKNGKLVEVDIAEVNVGDVFIVKAGEQIPVDGIVIEGTGAVDEAALTGESIPVDKEINDKVSAATINKSGYMKCKALRVGKDTTLSQIIQMVSDAAATKAPIAKIADKVSGVFVPVVISISLITLGAWLLAGQSIGFALARAISVLVISCPCALGLATPVAIMVGNGVGAKNGILFKTAASLEETGKAQIMALDKTGTITKGQPKVTEVIASHNRSETEVVQLAATIEAKSEHPLAKAIIEYYNEGEYPEIFESTDYEVLPGNGVRASVLGRELVAGSLRFIETKHTVDEEMKAQAELLSKEGKTPLLFVWDNQLVGMIGVADIIKEDSKEAVKQLENMGIQVVMLTGDNEITADAIAKKAGIKNVFASVLPEEKEAIIRKLSQQGKVIMVGDGINDAPALTRADIGIAIGAGADVAIDAADVVLMNNSLLDAAAAVRLSRNTLRNIKENLFWAFIYNVIGIPLAAGVFINVLGWELNPMFGAAAMSLSSFCVVSNALRLNLTKLKDSSKDKKIINMKGKDKTMTKTMSIEGMMCGHCEARVKKVLEELAGVSKAEVSHENNTAVVYFEEEVANEVLTKAVVDAGYEVTNIE